MRAYLPEFKARVVAECEKPGASVAKVALANGLNANMVHTWRRETRTTLVRTVPGAGEFVPLALPVPSAAAVASCAPVRIELRQGTMSVSVAWPVEAAGACGSWLRELLK